MTQLNTILTYNVAKLQGESRSDAGVAMGEPQIWAIQGQLYIDTTEAALYVIIHHAESSVYRWSP